MRILVWLLRAFIFFSLFAFSLNNLHTATLHWYFGQSWSAPMVIVVLVAFGAGAAFGVLAMTPQLGGDNDSGLNKYNSLRLSDTRPPMPPPHLPP